MAWSTPKGKIMIRSKNPKLNLSRMEKKSLFALMLKDSLAEERTGCSIQSKPTCLFSTFAKSKSNLRSPVWSILIFSLIVVKKTVPPQSPRSW